MNEKSRAGPRAATLAQAASLAQASEITVSRIIRNKGPIEPTTRERVMAAVREIGYVPNKVAGALASAGSDLMGVILPSLSNIVFPEVLRGVHDSLGASGYHARLRYEGFREALTQAGVGFVAQSLVEGPSSTLASREKLGELRAAAPDIDAVYVSDDDMAVGGVFHCLGAGIVVKEQRAIFGFNGLDIGEALPTPLSTVRSNQYLIGRLAVEEILDSPKRSTSPVVIDAGFEIVVGATA